MAQDNSDPGIRMTIPFEVHEPVELTHAGMKLAVIAIDVNNNETRALFWATDTDFESSRLCPPTSAQKRGIDNFLVTDGTTRYGMLYGATKSKEDCMTIAQGKTTAFWIFYKPIPDYKALKSVTVHWSDGGYNQNVLIPLQVRH
jgi:hypothetical protein